MGRKYFGTDGIRGVANELLTAELALAVGRAAVVALGPARPRILIGRDTRVSGPMLEGALVAGISSAGGEAVLAGVVPTPAVASLVISQSCDAGAVISASHNPYQDNGIKFFGPTGFKLTDAQEAEMETFLAHDHTTGGVPEPGAVRRLDGAADIYIDNLLRAFDIDLTGVRVAIDCANGAVFQTSPRALRRLGAEVTVVCDQPDGYNINAGCGSTHMAALQKKVKADGFDLGLAFDGDGDRVLAVDSAGEIVDGDFIMAICGMALKNKGQLARNTIVTTVMTNLGFHLAMEQLGIHVKTTAVGDRYVMEEMLADGFNFGGEQSGHLINLATGTTGDGLATALLLLQVMQETGKPLAELARIMTRLPQKLVNVRVANMKGLDGATEIWGKVAEESGGLGEKGRVLLRSSGTEPVVRVMVEAQSHEICDDVCTRLVTVVERVLGRV